MDVSNRLLDGKLIVQHFLNFVGAPPRNQLHGYRKESNCNAESFDGDQPRQSGGDSP
jgi:hypothetical protein